jgi:hypothetical protein
MLTFIPTFLLLQSFAILCITALKGYASLTGLLVHFYPPPSERLVTILTEYIFAA